MQLLKVCEKNTAGSIHMPTCNASACRCTLFVLIWCCRNAAWAALVAFCSASSFSCSHSKGECDAQCWFSQAVQQSWVASLNTHLCNMQLHSPLAKEVIWHPWHSIRCRPACKDLFCLHSLKDAVYVCTEGHLLAHVLLFLRLPLRYLVPP